MFLEMSPVSGDIARKNIFVFWKNTWKKRNKNLEVNETFVQKVPPDEVGIHVDGPNFDADEVNTNNSNDEERRNTLNDFDSIDYENLKFNCSVFIGIAWKFSNFYSSNMLY